MHQSKVKWFDAKKGYGFIDHPEDGDDVFVHYSQIISDKDFKTLRTGQEVTFEMNDGPKGLHALDVKALHEQDEAAEDEAAEDEAAGETTSGPVAEHEAGSTAAASDEAEEANTEEANTEEANTEEANTEEANAEEANAEEANAEPREDDDTNGREAESSLTEADDSDDLFGDSDDEAPDPLAGPSF